MVSPGISGNSVLSCTPPKGSTPQPLGESSRAEEFCHPLLGCNYSALLVPVLISNVTALVSQELILDFSTESNIKAVISAAEQSQTQQAATGVFSKTCSMSCCSPAMERPVTRHLL